MSTRRARIKAVTALPPRRKNVDNTDGSKLGQPIKQELEKSNDVKSQLAEKSQEIGMHKTKNTPAPGNVVNPSSDKAKSPFTESQNVMIAPEKSPTPILSEKVSAITSSVLAKPVFLSPQPRDSPLKKVFFPITPKYDNENKYNVAQEIIDYKIQQAKTLNPDTSKLASGATNDIIDVDYNVPSVPESVTEDAMDGIIPLQTESSAPKPIALLINEIISENAEVFFDPIVPLPSPSKVRPKLRPVPRLGPLRRNSIQGSASESEDESKRALMNNTAALPQRQRHDSQTSHGTVHSHPNREVNRVRNDSVCSNASILPSMHSTTMSPLKEKLHIKTRKHDVNRRSAAMRKKRETAKRESLTMYDLIFCNPVSNPIVPDQDELKAKEATELDAEREKEDGPDDPPQRETAVPQLKMGPNGEIVLDEASLVVKSTESRRVARGVVREGAWSKGSSGYRRSARTADWSEQETVRFYRALAGLGTDFLIMQELFPGRTRADLKKKFKKEEKLNLALVDKALKTSTQWDLMKLKEEFIAERNLADKKAQEKRKALEQTKKEDKLRQKAMHTAQNKSSLGSKSILFSALPHAATKSEIGRGVIVNLAKTKKMKATKRKPEVEDNSIPDIGNKFKFEINNSFKSSIVSRNEDKTSISEAPDVLESVQMPRNIEKGSLVVLSVADPNAPTKKILQTYIANEKGALTPVALPPNFLNSVVGYMNKGTPKSSNISVASSPSLASPCSVSSQDYRNMSDAESGNALQKQRHSSYTITPL